MNKTTTTRTLLCGLMAAVASGACASRDAPVPQDASAVTLAAPSSISPVAPSITPVAPVTSRVLPASPAAPVVSPSAVCDVAPLSEATRAGPWPDDSHTSVSIVAYGDVDSDDDVPCAMLPDVRIAVIQDTSQNSSVSLDLLEDWWTAVGGDELGIRRFIPPGVRVPSTAERLASAPAQFITTGPDGTAELRFDYDPETDDHSLCAISPIDDLIAGCKHNLSLRGFPSDHISHITVYIYFTHGHAIIEVGASDRYQRFLDDTGSTGTPATITFEATDNDDIEPSYPSDNTDIIVVGAAHVNAWWTAIYNGPINELEANRLQVTSENLAHDWAHVITTGPDGSAETALPPGDYLICSATWRGNLDCIYENLASGHHTYLVNFWLGGNLVSITKRS